MAQREYMGGEAVDEDGTFRCIIHIVPIQEEPSLETLIKLGRGGGIPYLNDAKSVRSRVG